MLGLRTPGEEIAFTARPKIHSHSQIFRYGRSIFLLPYQPNFSNIFMPSLVVRSLWEYALHMQCPKVQNWSTNFWSKILISWIEIEQFKGQLISKCPFSVIVLTKIPWQFFLRISALAGLASKKRLNLKKTRALYFIKLFQNI